MRRGSVSDSTASRATSAQSSPGRLATPRASAMAMMSTFTQSALKASPEPTYSPGTPPDRCGAMVVVALPFISPSCL